MPAFWLAIAAAVLTVINIGISIYRMLQEPPKPPTPSPGTVSDVPIAEQGADIPVLFGTRWLTRPNVVWWGKNHVVKNKVNSSELN